MFSKGFPTRLWKTVWKFLFLFPKLWKTFYRLQKPLFAIFAVSILTKETFVLPKSAGSKQSVLRKKTVLLGGGGGVERGVGKVTCQVFVVALDADHGGVVAAEGEGRQVELTWMLFGKGGQGGAQVRVGTDTARQH